MIKKPVPVYECGFCGINFTKPGQSNVYKYCSHVCRGKARKGTGKGRIVLKCEWCSEPFVAWPYEVKLNRRFCSVNCFNSFKDEGKTTEAFRLRTSVAYARWRTAVFERDDYTCQECGEHGGKLNADHIKKFADYPGLRLSVDNGRTLCEPCHKKTDTFGRRKPATDSIYEATAVGVES